MSSALVGWSSLLTRSWTRRRASSRSPAAAGASSERGSSTMPPLTKLRSRTCSAPTVMMRATSSVVSALTSRSPTARRLASSAASSSFWRTNRPSRVTTSGARASAAMPGSTRLEASPRTRPTTMRVGGVISASARVMMRREVRRRSRVGSEGRVVSSTTDGCSRPAQPKMKTNTPTYRRASSGILPAVTSVAAMSRAKVETRPAARRRLLIERCDPETRASTAATTNRSDSTAYRTLVPFAASEASESRRYGIRIRVHCTSATATPPTIASMIGSRVKCRTLRCTIVRIATRNSTSGISAKGSATEGNGYSMPRTPPSTARTNPPKSDIVPASTITAAGRRMSRGS